MGNWKRRILAIVLCAAMVTATVPAMADSSEGHSHSGESVNWEPFYDEAGMVIINGTDPKYLYLVEDVSGIKYGSNFTSNKADSDLTICFNGHQLSIGTICVGGLPGEETGNSLTLTDCSADGSGGISGTFSLLEVYSPKDAYPENNRLTIDGGTYTIGRTGQDGMLFRLYDNAGDAIINGGKLISKNGTGTIAIYVGYEDTLYINGGSIIAYQDLSNPFSTIKGTGKVVMNGGEIKGCLLDTLGRFSSVAGIAPMMEGIEIYGGKISGDRAYGVGVSNAEYGRCRIVTDDYDDEILISGSNGVETSPVYFEDSPGEVYICTDVGGEITITGNGNGRTEISGYGICNNDAPKDAKGAFRPNSVIATADSGIITFEGTEGGFYNGLGSKAALSSIRVSGVNSGIVNYGTMTVDGKSMSPDNQSYVWATGENGSGVKNYGVMRIGGGKDCSFSGMKYGIENYGTLIIDGNVNITGTTAAIYNKGTVIFTKNADGCSILSDEGTGLYNEGAVLFGEYADGAFAQERDSHTVIPRISGPLQAIYTTTDIPQNVCYGVVGDGIFLANGSKITCDWDIPEGLWEKREGKAPAVIDFDEIPAYYVIVNDWGDCNGDVQLGNLCFQMAQSEFYLGLRSNGPLCLECRDAYHVYDGAVPADQTAHPGQHLVTCSRCGLQYVNNGMTYADCTYGTREVIDPEPSNCQETGFRYEETYCAVCGRVESRVKGESVTGPHVYENGICKYCGEYEEPAQITGDKRSNYFYGKLGLSSDYVGFYAMENAGNLLWYATENNNRDRTHRIINAKWVLLNDINMNPKYDVRNYINSAGVPEDVPEDIVRWIPIGLYNSVTHINTGVFDGNGHKISGLFVDGITWNKKEDDTYSYAGGKDYVGLFGYIGYDCVIRNLSVTRSYFGGGQYVGSFVGRGDAPKDRNCVENCTTDAMITAISSRVGGIAGEWTADYSGCVSDGSIYIPESRTVEYVGGIVGYGANANIAECINYSEINGPRSNAGGIAGKLSASTVKDCGNFGTVSIQQMYAGGIAGDGNNCVIENCVNAADISSNMDKHAMSEYVGGIIGRISGENAVIRECQNAGTVTGYYYIGGISGSIIQGTIAFCFNTGNVVSNNYSGGITGDVEACKAITNCFTLGEVSGGNYTGRLFGWLIGAPGSIASNFAMEGNGKVVGTINGATGLKQEDCGHVATREQFQSGMICYALNNGKSDSGVLFRQDLSDTAMWYPSFNAAKVVYRTHPCEIAYTNSPNETRNHQDSDGDGICDVCEMRFFEDGFAVVAGYSLEVNDRIAVDVYLQLDDSVWDYDDLAIVVTGENGTPQTIPLSADAAEDLRKIENNEVYYVVSVPMTAKDYSEDFSVQLYFDGQSGKAYSFSVDDYIQYIIAHADEYEEKEVNLAKAMGLYCSMANCYFDDALDAEELLQSAAEKYQTADLMTKYSFDNPTIKSTYDVFHMTGMPEGFFYIGESLLLLDNIRYRMYFSFAPEREAELEKYGLQKLSEDGGLCYFEIESLYFSNIGDKFKFSIDDFSVVTNPAHYIEIVLKMYNYENDPELVILIKALYLFWQTSLAYRG